MKLPTRERRRAILRAVLLNTLLVLFSFGFAAIAAEIAIRIVAPQQLIMIRPDLWQPADTVGWLHRPNVAVSINTGERDVTVRTDQDGFRVGQAGRTEGELTVLLLGDSFMEALQVEHEQTAAHGLEQTLARATGATVAVRNAGIGGWNPSQYLLRAEQVMARDSFDLVVVALFVGNDAAPERTEYLPPRAPVERHRFRLPRRFSGRELRNAFLAPVNDALETRSHLFVLLKNQLSALRMRLGLTAQYLPHEYRRDQTDAPRWSIAGDVAADIASVAAAHGTPTLFVLVPEAFQVYPDRWAAYIQGFDVDSASVDVNQPNRRLGEELEQRGLCWLDLLEPFRAAARGGPALFGAVDQHFSAEGHALMAEIVAPAAAWLMSEGPDDRPACPLRA